MTNLRIGHGYDVHRLTAGRPLILGGVRIPYDRGLDGHSDADVLTHAVMDALLGAAALGDIGQLFPDSDDAFLNISSLTLLSRVRDALAGAGYRVVNIDATLIAQAPKVGPTAGRCRRTWPPPWTSAPAASTSRPPPRSTWASPATAPACPPMPWP